MALRSYRFIVLCLALPCLVWGCGSKDDGDLTPSNTDVSGPQSDAGGSDGTPKPIVTDGPTLYATYCELCHGENGVGYKADGANQLANQNWLSITSDTFISKAIARGRPGTSMSAWGLDRGGPLNDQQVQALVTLIRSWQTVPSENVDDVVIDSPAGLAKATYKYVCASCHGSEGQGGTFMSLNNPEFLANASDGYLQHSIAMGRPGTPMMEYGTSQTPQMIDALVALIRSWQTPVDNTTLPQRSDNLGDVVLNPNGPEPALGDERFVSVDVVSAELAKGAKMVIIDARPHGDYLVSHIAGAVSVPFYAVEDYLDQLPKDVWIVAYCACPHAESGIAADTLEKNGFTLVRVLDEGFNVWTEKGYPVTLGQ